MSAAKHPTIHSLDEALRAAAEPLTTEARQRIRQRVMVSVRPEAAGLRHGLALRRVAAVAAAVALLAGGTAYAANRSLPGDALYGLKRGAEDALVLVLPAGRLEQRVLAALAVRRAEEAARLARGGADESLVNGSIGELQDAVRRAAESAGSLATEDRERIREHASSAPEPARTRIENAVREQSEPGGQLPPDTGPASGPDASDTSGPARGGVTTDSEAPDAGGAGWGGSGGTTTTDDPGGPGPKGH